MNAATLGVCAPNIVARHVQRRRMCIAKGARGAFRVPGSVTYRYWPLYCSSRVMGNYHARFLGGWARATAPGYPPPRCPRRTRHRGPHCAMSRALLAANAQQRAETVSALRGTILSLFKRTASRSCRRDVAVPKVVPPDRWCAAPAERPSTPDAAQ
jgi:hypothetical protein